MKSISKYFLTLSCTKVLRNSKSVLKVFKKLKQKNFRKYNTMKLKASVKLEVNLL